MFSKHKRILIFNDSLALGGTEKLLVNLLNHLVEKKCKVTLLLPEMSDENVLLPEISEEVTIRYLYDDKDTRFARKKGELNMIFRTKSFLKKKEIFESDYDDVVCFKEGFYAKMFSEMDIPKTLWLHNILYVRKYEPNTLKEKISAWLNKKEVAKVQESYALYDRVISVSDACKQSYVEVVFEGNLPIQDIRIVPNAINLEKVLALSKEYIEDDMSTTKTKFIVLTRMSPDKRVDRILNVASRLEQEGYDNFVVHVLGSGTDNEDMQADVNHLGLRDVIYLHGKKDNPYPYVKQSNWLLCVSERESFSLAILEAMALGVPVITTDCGGPANIVENGKYGILVDNSGEGVYEAMKSVLDDPTLSEKYTSDLAKATSRYNFEGWLKTVDKLLSV